jgi:hypothetical protein
MLKNKSLFAIVVVIALSIPMIIPFFMSGFFSFHDDTQVPRVYLMWNSLSDGMFPVRWVTDLGYGYGYPIFNFYAPFPYYVGAIFNFVLQDSLLATKAMFVIALIGSGISMYFLAQKFFGKLPAITAAVVYMYFPYHAVNTYVRGNISELYSYVFIPLFFLAWFGLYYAQKKSEYYLYGIVISVSYALIVISHNLSAYMTAFFALLLFIPSVILVKHKKSFLTYLIAGGVLACLLSAFYWIPVITEMKYTDVNSQLGGGSNVFDHFICINQFWNSPWGYTGSVPGCIDGMTFRLGKGNILVGIVSLVIAFYYVFFRKRKEIFIVLSAIVGIFISLFMMTEYSTLVWKVIPGIEYLQFPWRFLNYFALFLAFIVGSAVYYSGKLHKYFLYAFFTCTVLLTIFINGKLFLPQEIFPRDTSFYTNREYIGYEVTKKSDEYLPAGFLVLDNSSQIPSSIVSQTEQISVKVTEEKSHFFSAEITAENEVRALINISYFPAWRVFINGEEQEVKKEIRGFSVVIPQGNSQVDIKYIQTTPQKLGNSLSLLGLVCIVGIIYLKRYERK